MTSKIRFQPGRLHRAVRIASQSLAWIALLTSPLLGALDRKDADGLSAWRSPTELPNAIPVVDNTLEVPLRGGTPPVVRGVVYGLMLCHISFVGQNLSAPFIYFQF